MGRQSRRSFLKKVLAAAATITIAGTKSTGVVLGANDTIRIGVAGLRGRGGAHVRAFSKLNGVQVTYLIDPDTQTFDTRVKTVQQNGGNTPQTIADVRKALDDKELDAIAIATPNHWHALMTIWACQAGKDVYVEKPCSHNIHEGRIAVDMARKHQRIVQHGTGRRSDPQWIKLAALIRSGKLGKPLVSRGLCYKARGSIGTKAPSDAPANLDFNLWLGPAAATPFHANLVHYNWHWFWDFGNGEIGNQGVHQMDVARWMIPGATLPRSVISLGGRFGYVDQAETPNTQITVCDYGETQLIFEVRGLKTDGFRDVQVGNIIYLEGGTVCRGKSGLKFFPKGSDQAEPLADLGDQDKPEAEEGHFGNFIAAVRSRKQADLNADILEGHYSSALCHLANMSYRLGTQVPFNPKTKALGDNKEAYETLSRMENHLTTANELKLEVLKYQLGRKLEIDAKTETIVSNPEANKLLTRSYRKPFVVPEKA